MNSIHRCDGLCEKTDKMHQLSCPSDTKFYLYSDKSKNVTMELVMILKGDDKNEFHENIFYVSWVDICLGIECLTRKSSC